MKVFETNLDGLIGPTHNYAGLSVGNVASLKNAGLISNPREAAKQGLRKMKKLHDLGLKQGILPPQERPDLETLRRLGFIGGSDAEVLEKVQRSSPEILAACYSASSMWTANAATVSPSADCSDSRVHFTPANLVSKFHRSIEAAFTGKVLEKIFSNKKHFVHHPALESTAAFGDEGAANHTRLCRNYGEKACELFVYGRSAFNSQNPEPKKFPARQSLEASQAVARLHGLDFSKTIFAQQNPEAIDAGVFHNDVISVGNRNVFFFHEKAFLQQEKVIQELQSLFSAAAPLHLIEVKNSEVPLEDAVVSYLFNSQLVSLNDDSMMLLVPEECRTTTSVWTYLEKLLRSAKAPIQKLEVFDLKQSMRNGGGPACLRLRVVLSEEEFQQSAQGIWMSDELFAQLTLWLDTHYRDQLSPADLADPQLIIESRTALDKLSQILGLGSLYSFQRA